MESLNANNDYNIPGGGQEEGVCGLVVRERRPHNLALTQHTCVEAAGLAIIVAFIVIVAVI